jgi:peptidoglycan/xylan/chitin deacetylase (PgdA/CDA1 family)
VSIIGSGHDLRATARTIVASEPKRQAASGGGLRLVQHFHIVLFGELQSPAEGKKPRLILSYDDGYKDFLDFAAPILGKRRIRVNHDIVPGCVESGHPPINVELQDFIASAPAALLRETRSPASPRAPTRIDATVPVFAPRPPSRRSRSPCKSGYLQSSSGPCPLRQISFNGHGDAERHTSIAAIHEFGVHSFEHASMLTESDDYLREDARKCAQYFQTKLGFGHRFVHFQMAARGRSRRRSSSKPAIGMF